MKQTHWNEDLAKACERGDTAKVKHWIDQGACLDARDETGHGVIHRALKISGRVSADLIEMLLVAGADVHGLTDLNESVILAYCQALPSMDPGQGLKVLKQLLNMDVNVNARDALGRTPLLTLAKWVGCPDELKAQALRMLIDAGADVHMTGMDYDHDSVADVSALHDTARLGHLACCEVLVQAGANVNAVTSEGNTPLHLAGAYAQNLDLLFLLVNQGANVLAINHQGLTPAALAKTKDHSPSSKWLEYLTPTSSAAC